MKLINLIIRVKKQKLDYKKFNKFQDIFSKFQL